jgi:serine/threonine protein kinase
VKAMRAVGLEHRDLSLRNILMRNILSSQGLWEPHVVFIDFGASRPLADVVYLDAKHNVDPSNYTSHKWKHRPTATNLTMADRNHSPSHQRQLSGNGVHTDLYSLTCAFYASVYQDLSCHGRLPPDLPSDQSTMKYAFAHIMRLYDSHTVDPDYTAVAREVSAAVKV